MKFEEITGHSEEIAKLRAMADAGRLPHALLLHGPSGIGKGKIARALIQYIFCTDRKNGDSCGKCPSCIQTSKLNNPDVHFIYPVIKRTKPSRAVSKDYIDEWKDFITRFPYLPEEGWLQSLEAGNSRPLIYVNESEELLRISSLSSFGNGYKVFMIWQPEKMNPEAANKILKLIEEPFDDTVFIFVSNNPGALLPTIRSRLQGVEFKPLPEKDMKAFFIKEGKNAEEAAALSKISHGNMNIASTLLQTEGELTEFNEIFKEVMRAAYGRKLPELKKYADAISSQGREKSLRLLNYFSRMTRESFISNLHLPDIEAMTPPERTFVSRFGPFINAANIEEISGEIDKAYEDISRNANQKIVWFDMFLQLCRLIRTKGMNK